MDINIIILLCCVPLYVINSFCDKIVSTINGNSCNRIYNCVKFFICAVCVMPLLLREGIQFGTGTLVCGCFCAVMYAVSKTVMLKGYDSTSVAFMTLCHSSGMIIPCVLGHFFWGERLTLLSICGIIVTVIAIILIKENKNKQKYFNAKGVLYGVIIFVTSAGVMITQKIMGIYFESENVALYNFYSFLVAALILCLPPKSYYEKKVDKRCKKTISICALGSAVSLSVISLVMTKLAADVPSVILFPLFNGLGIICVCIGSVFAFKEKLGVKNMMGLIFGVVGLYLINI